MKEQPISAAADNTGLIMDYPALTAAGRSGRAFYPLNSALLIPLPDGSRLYLLPGRKALGYDTSGKIRYAPDGLTAVAAFLPPGYVALSLAAFKAAKNAPLLPLFCYCAVCWYRGSFHVPAIQVDHDPKHSPSCSDIKKAEKAVGRWILKNPDNRLIAHHGQICVREYGCPNAVNLFLKRWEAPVAVSGACNALCQGCISRQNSAPIASPQQRIGFTPTVEEIVELAVPHLMKAPRAMISFGQGCEGEPLLKGKLIESAIRELRARTGRGTIHINTNGSLPGVVAKLAAAGLDSIRISMNSARPKLYSAYYRCRTYSFSDVIETFRIARDAGLWTSINYLTFPGVTDDMAEFAAFTEILREFKPHMIQWRNLNIDPDWYMDTVDRTVKSTRHGCMGVPALMTEIQKQFPSIRFGYFNQPVAKKESVLPGKELLKKTLLPLPLGERIEVRGKMTENFRRKTRRLPAEWERQDAVMLAWPHKDTYWAPVLKQVEPVFTAIAAAISRRSNVIIAVRNPSHVWKLLKKAGADLEQVALSEVATNDTWARDFGPITILESGTPVLLKYVFNGWGRKYPSSRDNLVATHMHSAGIFGGARLRHEKFVLEGGSIDSDGASTILTTSRCLLNTNRNPALSKSAIETRLKRSLGAKRILWLDHGHMEGDDTDGHVDTLARFAPGNVIVYVACDDPRDTHFTELKRMETELKSFRNSSGKPYRLLPLPWPAVKFDRKGNRMPATYANFLVTNGVVLVPTYRDKKDARALRVIRMAFPRYTVEGIDCLPLIQQHGSLHCLTMQLPAGVL